MPLGRWLSLLAAPAALSVIAGCHSIHLDQPADKVGKLDREVSPAGPAPPGKHSLRVSQYVFLYDFELKRDLPLFRELANLRDQVYKELQLSDSPTLVQVFLFEDRERYEAFMHTRYPDLPKRRAFFVAQPRLNGPEELLVYTYWGDRIQEDLRHELTHALLHSVLKDVPLWLDEGLAEYFEVPPEWHGINRRHLEFLRSTPPAPFQPELARLEGFSQVAQMTPADYREAWLWVHLMLNDRSEAKQVLIAYLQQLRVNPNPGPLGPRLAAVYPSLNDALTRHLAHLEGAPPTQRAQARVGLQ
jgi:hypothetical protein